MSDASESTPVDGSTGSAPAGAIGWLRRELSDDGEGQILPTIGRGLVLLSSGALSVLMLGLVATALSVIAWRDRTSVLVAMIVLCLPAIVAPLVARRGLLRLSRSVTRPRETAGQLRDLLTGVTDSPEVRELVDRFRGRDAAGPVSEARVGRLRRTVRSARLITGVVGAAEPDPQRHSLLLAFTPERTVRLFSSITWSAWGTLIAALVAFTATIAIVIDAL